MTEYAGSILAYGPLVKLTTDTDAATKDHLTSDVATLVPERTDHYYEGNSGTVGWEVPKHEGKIYPWKYYSHARL